MTEAIPYEKANIFARPFSLLPRCICAANVFWGITPGKTSRVELKSLVQKFYGVDTMDTITAALKQPEGQMVAVYLQNDVVYQVTIDVTPLLRQALIEKYGRPTIKAGTFRTVNCQNKFGATDQRVDGKESLQWPVKDGVQGEIERRASLCSEYIFAVYALSHVATVQVIEEESKEKARKESEERLRKLGGAL